MAFTKQNDFKGYKIQRDDVTKRRSIVPVVIISVVSTLLVSVAAFVLFSLFFGKLGYENFEKTTASSVVIDPANAGEEAPPPSEEPGSPSEGSSRQNVIVVGKGSEEAAKARQENAGSSEISSDEDDSSADNAGALPVSAQSGGVPDIEGQVKKSEPVEDSYFDDAMFIGDSITTGISLYGTMANATVVASTGINPSTILTKPVIRDKGGNLFTILEMMSKYNPGKIYIMLGANGIAWIDEEKFIKSYEELIAAVKKQHPNAIIYVQSIFPVTSEKSKSENGVFANDKIRRYNERIYKLCDSKGVLFLNVAQAVADESGALPGEVSPDGIHINPDYYQKWFEYLKTHVAKSK